MNEFATETPIIDRSIPFYFQIANLIRQKIELGELAAGEKLPKELDLSKTLGVSRVTLRQSLSILETEGLVTRERGQGTFVTKNLKSPQKIKLTGIIGQDVSHVDKRRIVSIDDVPPTPHQAEFFGITEKDFLTRIRRLLIVKKTPFCLVMNFLPIHLAKKVTRKDILNRSMVDIIKTRFRIPVGKIHQTFEARTASNEVASHLAIGIMDPVLYVETFVHGKKGEPLEFSQIYYRGNEHKYSIELHSNGDIV
jgi:GntR family transcriptional regulator